MIGYLALIPLSYRRFQDKLKADLGIDSPAMDPAVAPSTAAPVTAPPASGSYVPPTGDKALSAF